MKNLTKTLIQKVIGKSDYKYLVQFNDKKCIIEFNFSDVERSQLHFQVKMSNHRIAKIINENDIETFALQAAVQKVYGVNYTWFYSSHDYSEGGLICLDNEDNKIKKVNVKLKIERLR